MSQTPRTATAFAPATVANVAVGFDVMGFSFAELGDLVTVERVDDPDPEGAVVLDWVRGADFEGDQDLPSSPKENTATRALAAMVDDLDLAHGFRVRLEKGIPIGSGMGGSAASAVGAVVAGAALVDQSIPRAQLLRYALAGEAAASGSADGGALAHGDNVAPCLFGGLCCYLPNDPPEVVEIPVPSGLSCVLVRPRLRQDTRAQRAILRDSVSVKDFVLQSAHLAGFIAACFRDDVDLLRRSMRDVVIGPQRASTIPGAWAACAAARTAGALGSSIAGSGPSIFAFVADESETKVVRDAIVGTLAGHDIVSDAWVGPISLEGAKVRERS